MALQGNTGSAVSSLGGLGLGLGNGHAYAATGSILGLTLGTALVITGGVLVVVGLARMAASAKNKANAAAT